MELFNKLEKIKHTISHMTFMGKIFATRIRHVFDSPTYTTKEQQKRRKLIKYIGLGTVATIGGSVLYKVLNNDITITLEKGDSPRKRIKEIYDNYRLDEALISIYPHEQYSEDYKNPEARFRLFFLACASEIFYFQGKDVYQVGDAFTFNPYEILEKIKTNPIARHEERILHTGENLSYKEENEQLLTQMEQRFNDLYDDKETPSIPSQKEEKRKEKVEEKPKQKEAPIPTSPKEEKKKTKKKEKKNTSRGIEAQREFIQDNKDLVITEMHKYKIPASIKLAQGILESGSGKSELTQETNNYFCMKCHDKDHKKYAKHHEHCYRQKDDHREDRFFMYASKKDSFRAHSQLLSTGRYRIMRNSSITKKEAEQHFTKIYERHKGKSYYTPRKKLWEKAIKHRDTPHLRRAYGLSAMGYATSAEYAQKLINLIETHNLTQYDH